MISLKEEVRNGHTISTEMKKVWAAELKLLNKLLDVCNKHHLKIWAEGGTLLGTIRHHGFIPWDDDIDMAMPRDDYDKLQTIAKDEFKDPYFFQSGHTDLFPNGMTRIRMNGTTAIFYKSIYHKYHQGIFIDIFPLDAIPDDDHLFKTFIAKQEKLQETMMLSFNNRFSFTNLKYDWIVFKAKIKIRRKGFHSYFAEYDNFVKQFSLVPHRKVSIYSWMFNKRYIRENNWYSETLYMPFEDIMIPVPSKYHKILTTQYGDYMKPVKEPTMHGDYIILDTEHPYSDYLPKLRKEHRWDWVKEWLKIIGFIKEK